jgi:hypothetical protein
MHSARHRRLPAGQLCAPIEGSVSFATYSSGGGVDAGVCGGLRDEQQTRRPEMAKFQEKHISLHVEGPRQMKKRCLARSAFVVDVRSCPDQGGDCLAVTAALQTCQ